VLGINRPIAWRFALIRGKLRAQGQLISQPDILIAANALQYGLTLLLVTSEISNAFQTLTSTNHANHRLS
jgi:predicted nucleic acid-binding protein